MSLAVLPTELLDAIFEPLPSQALVALTTASTALNPSATRLLYRHIALSSHARNLSAVCTLAVRPDLAQFARTFTISLDDGSDGASYEYYVMLAKALEYMGGLTSLELHVATEASWVLAVSDSTAAMRFARLEHFSSSFPFDAHLASFLTRTPGLQSLQLSTLASPTEVDLPVSAIPSLHSYTGPASLLHQLLPTRPLTSLHLSGDLSPKDIEHLATGPGSEASDTDRTTTRVEVLSAITSVPPVIVLDSLARACPHLVCLRLLTTCAFWEAPDLTFYTRIANTLSTLPSLESFELSGMHWESRLKSSQLEGGRPTEKEWVSPPVTPRPVDVVEEQPQDPSFDFDEAFMEWAY